MSDRYDGGGTVAKIVKRLYFGAVNQRNALTLTLNFFVNFSPILLWLIIFKNAGAIPIEVRPKIHSKAAFLLDIYLFGDLWNELLFQYNNDRYRMATFVTSFAFAVVCLVLIPVAIWYFIYYVKKVKYNVIEWYDHIFHFSSRSNPKRLRVLVVPFLLPLVAFLLLNFEHTFAVQTNENFQKWKDILAWFSYVILHLTAPILTAVYLYVFHPPGTVKCFALALGLQNLMGVCTHLLLPMAPPWFVHLYGINDVEHVNYTQKGYAAGLTRVDSHLGTHLNNAGFHLSPIVFGAVPSLHSAMAVQCFLFLVTRSTTLKNRFTAQTAHGLDAAKSPEDLELASVDGTSQEVDQESLVSSTVERENDGEVISYLKYYHQDPSLTNRWYFTIFNKAILPRFLGTGFIILQWWATMYLDHHYRFDLFIGVLYALFMHILINNLILQPRVLTRWIQIRTGQEPDTKNEGRTLGMRVFENTRFEWFFDPLA
ncbi:hypothetical protein HG536_0D02150 [Torulaspora globosa]|uniref:Inositolphosphotransferase Aur1/Ipt1 domain-containing protein n=1 Tax=Torulaspora globosa TaxID=48254 RepID=A0A7G3ZGQ7_9SACH|nr:uncharacterized protein HG536_0D02150 [Torulaspora globosa]QLL32693.1 hypothetical protein HG536_0D02150 [Torulaspora globosa]